MRKRIFAIAGISMSIMLFVASCAKDGEPGATGPAGPQGPPGSSGAAGPSGVPGPPGTANVVYSPWLNVKYEGSDTTGWFATIDAPKLVDSIINKGDVKVFLNIGSDSTNDQFIVPLPIRDIIIPGLIITPAFQPQLINLVSNYDVSSDSVRGYHYFQYRYILIPGGTASGRTVSINWNDYNQVKQYLNLKD